MLFVVPGKDETLRVNGRAWVVTEGWAVDACASPDLARPKAVLGVSVDEVRSGLSSGYDAELAADRPSA